MSQFPNENDGNRSVAASDFVQLGQPDDEEVKVFRCSEDDQQDEEMMTPETELEETPNAFSNRVNQIINPYLPLPWPSQGNNFMLDIMAPDLHHMHYPKLYTPPHEGSAVNSGSVTMMLCGLNEHLSGLAYLRGFLPSQEDAYVFSSFESAPADQYPNAARWYKHIQSFSEAERSAWPKRSPDGAAVSTSSTSAPKEAKATSKQAAGGDDDYAEKKSSPIAKSNVIYDIKPWDDTIDTKEIEKAVRAIETDGLVWGTSKVLPVAFGINKLQICCCVEDEKVSTDWLEEQITGIEDLVQSVDVVAFNKV